jgi:ATP-binding cassette subfamily C protein
VRALKTFFRIIDGSRRRKLYLLFVAVVIMAGLEVVSVGSIMPFLQVAADPASVQEKSYLRWGYETFGFTNTDSFLIWLGLAALTALVVSNAFIVITTWALYRYAWGCNHALSWRLLRSYLDRPYEYFLTRNSSELGKNILEEVKEVVGRMLIPGLRGMAKGVVAIFIIGFLIFVDPVIALMVTTTLGVAYTAIYFLVEERIRIYGEKRVDTNTQRYETVDESFGGIKSVKMLGVEDNMIKKYKNPSRKYSYYKAMFKVVNRAPRYILEVVAFGAIIVIAIYLIAAKEDIKQVIPMLGLYAFAGYRLMPALQSAFNGITSAKFNLAALEELKRGLEKESNINDDEIESLRGDYEGNLTAERVLFLDKVKFAYPNTKEPAIKNLSLTIPARTTLGVVGKTGSGKTTLVDIILGLLQPQQGEVTVDGTPLHKRNLARWRKNIGYVPQQIYLSDDTIACNIAFGVAQDNINMKAVRDAARRARIFDFVVSDLPNQWDTVVGERGVKLSGGQRQRIGVARALYRSPSILVFDEATSALDQATESSVMEAIYGLEEDHTIILVAHRLSTVRRADKILMLEDGKKVAEGTYDNLVGEHEKFRSMALS